MIFELRFVVAPKSATLGLTVVTVSLMCRDAIFALPLLYVKVNYLF